MKTIQISILRIKYILLILVFTSLKYGVDAQSNLRVLDETNSTESTNSTENTNSQESESHEEKLETNEAWIYGILFSIGIGLIGFLVSVIVVPFFKKFSSLNEKLSVIISYLISFAIGALLGDVVIHIVPEVYIVESEEPTLLENVVPGLFTLLGILIFFLIEKGLHAYGISHSHEGHGHSHAKVVNQNQNQNQNEDRVINMNPSDIQSMKQTSVEDIEIKEKKVKPEGYLNLIADFLHNIMDGLAIGIVFANGTKSVISSTIVAIIAHEIPQEVGDVGILIHSGLQWKKVILCNGLVNFSAVIGTIIGLAIGQINEDFNKLMLAFIAGNFLYISLVDMMPCIIKINGLKNCVFQVITFLLGIGIMVLVKYLEGDDHDHGHGHKDH